MGYYDNVKDSIREENSDKDESGASASSDSSGESSMDAGNFDTLREAAQDNDVEEEEEGDDTPIEILEEDGLRPEAPSKQQKQRSKQSRQQASSQHQQQSSRQKSDKKESRGTQTVQREDNTEKTSSGRSNASEDFSTDSSNLEDKLDRIIEQNARMIEILEGFGN